MLKTLAEWRQENQLNEMAARRSFSRTMAKFRGPANLNRPIAILTAFRQEFDLKTNRNANKHLESLLKQNKLSFYPVIGAGQEPDGQNPLADEESYVVQPIDPSMREKEFLDIVRGLLFNPSGDLEHAQWGAVVKLPSRQDAFLLHRTGKPSHPSDYSSEFSLGKSARFAQKTDPNFTQMLKGPRLDATMQNATDVKRDRVPGRRFVVDN